MSSSDLPKLLRNSVKPVHKSVYLLALQITWFSEKMLISNRCICGFMPNLHKKSWMVSIVQSGPSMMSWVDPHPFNQKLTHDHWQSGLYISNIQRFKVFFFVFFLEMITCGNKSFCNVTLHTLRHHSYICNHLYGGEESKNFNFWLLETWLHTLKSLIEEHAGLDFSDFLSTFFQACSFILVY